MQEPNPYKWTLRLLKIQIYLPLFMSAAFVVLILLKVLPNAYGLLFVAALFLAYSFVADVVLKGIKNKKEFAWIAAVIFVVLCLPSLVMPLGIMSLVELFDEETKQNYFKKTVNLGTPEDPLYSHPVPKRGDNSTVKAALICGVIVVLIIVYAGFGSKFSTTMNVDQKLSPRQLYQMGAECNSKGDTDCSIAVFQRVLEMDPKDMTALANLGMAQARADHNEDAVATLKKYFDRGGQAIDAMAYYAQALNNQGRQTEALSWYAQTLAQSPNLIDVVESMVKILAAQSRYQEGLDLVDHFIEKNPSAAESLQSQRDFLMEKVRVTQETTI